MQLTTQTIIQQLPIEQELKAGLLSRLETADDDTKFYLEREIWDVYFSLQDFKIDENAQLKLEEIKKGEANFGTDFYKQVVEEEDKESQKENIKSTDTAELEKVRSRLQQLIN